MSFVASKVRPVCAPENQTMCFSVYADAEPNALPKLCLPIAKRGIMITALHASVLGNELQLDFQIADMQPKTAQQIAQTMRQFPGVTCVLVSEKG